MDEESNAPSENGPGLLNLNRDGFEKDNENIAEQSQTCNICQKSFSQKSYLTAHMKRHVKVRPFKCDLCDKGFVKKSEMIVHMRSHTKEKPFICSECGKAFGTSILRTRHARRLHPNGGSQAPNSGTDDESEQWGNLNKDGLETGNDHTTSSHEDDMVNFEMVSKTDQVENVEEGRTICQKDFEEITNDVDPKPMSDIPCLVCGESFPIGEVFENHNRQCLREKESRNSLQEKESRSCLQENDSGEIPQEKKGRKSRRKKEKIVDRLHTCKLCQKNFSQKSYLTAHMKRHVDVRPFKCDLCDKGFVKKSEMIVHMRSHTKEKPFICSECGKAFGTSILRTRHVRQHHQNGASRIAVKVSSGRPYLCEVCGKGLSTMSNLESHMRTHTGEKPYVCEMCGMRFRFNAALLSHLRTHLGIKPFSCEVCGKSFTASATLIRHKQTHREKTLQCPYCGKMFSQQSKLHKHINSQSCLPSSEATNDTPNQCRYCKAKYATYPRLLHHLKVKHELPYGLSDHQCPNCFRQFLNIGSMKRHIKNNSCYSAPKICDVCNRQFKTGSGLFSHMRNCYPQHDKDSTMSTAECEHSMVSDSPSQEKSCAICSKVFSSDETLREHVMTHFAEQTS